jgi:hypothetical protein
MGDWRMTNQELITKLMSLDPDAEVYIDLGAVLRLAEVVEEFEGNIIIGE